MRIDMVRGDTQIIALQVDAVAAGWDFVVSIRKPWNSKSVTLAMGTVGADGKAVFVLHPERTQAMWGAYLADVQLTAPDGVVKTMIPAGNDPYDPIFDVIVHDDVTDRGGVLNEQ